MKAIEVRQYGGPEVLEIAERDVPEPGPGEVQIRVEAAGVNYIDTYHRTGLYPIELPFIPGQEGCGIVTKRGNGLSGLSEGDRVAWAPATGSYAQYRVLPADKAVPVPERVSSDVAAAVMLQGMTAHYLTHSTFPLVRGHRVLIHAAAGGVGLLFIQMAKRRGAFVFGTAGTPEKADLAMAAGADHVILYREEDFVEEVKRVTGGEGLDAVFDSVGQATLEQSIRCLKPRGTLVSFGQSSGPVLPFDIRRLSAGSLYLTRPSLGHYVARREDLLERAGDIFEWIASEELHVRIDSRFPLDAAADAHRRLESRESSGKILLTC